VQNGYCIAQAVITMPPLLNPSRDRLFASQRFLPVAGNRVPYYHVRRS
jgi:hypothetical protein